MFSRNATIWQVPSPRVSRSPMTARSKSSIDDTPSGSTPFADRAAVYSSQSPGGDPMSQSNVASELPADIDEVRMEEACFPPLGPSIKVLMVWPRIPSSFWGFQAMLDLISELSILPPLGLITVAALCPPTWEIRLIDRAFQELSDDDLRRADLVMVSAMQIQHEDAYRTLARARALGRRTMVGGPFASSQPELLLPLVDHVVVGEPDEVFDEIARDVETGSARRLYRIDRKPDLRTTPPPRFDLLRLEKYASMAVQFSRGCPFQCEFCDIITIYGRRPRVKTPAQVVAELEALLRLGWRKQVFVVDDNLIGNHNAVLELVRPLESWQKRHGYPFIFYAEASLDLAQRAELIDAMVKANFFYVFLGIETPSKESLTEARKFQNLRRDLLDCVRFIQRRGLWVTAGFIVGFDSDPPDIFDRQIEFIERAAIPWAMVGFLQAPPTTPLFDRMRKAGRLLEDSAAVSNFNPPNFRTLLPLPDLLRGLRRTLLKIYEPDRFYARGLRSLYYWKIREGQCAPSFPLHYRMKAVVASLWRQGVRSSYRRAYWRFLISFVIQWRADPQKLWLGFVILISAHHFVSYAREVAAELDAEIRRAERP